jgi:hypothetical protein
MQFCGEESKFPKKKWMSLVQHHTHKYLEEYIYIHKSMFNEFVN